MSRAFANHHLRSLTLVGIAGLAACGTSSEATELDRVVLAMGGDAAVRAATNERIVAHGDRYFPGQGTSYTEPRHLSTFDYVQTDELDADRLHIDRDHVHDYLYDDHYHFTEVVDGTAGFVTGHDGYFPSPPESAMFSSRVTSELQHARLVSPLRLIREALGDPARVTDRGTLEVYGRT
jgi:hypothetical protein